MIIFSTIYMNYFIVVFFFSQGDEGVVGHQGPRGFHGEMGMPGFPVSA